MSVNNPGNGDLSRDDTPCLVKTLENSYKVKKKLFMLPDILFALFELYCYLSGGDHNKDPCVIVLSLFG